MGPYVRVRRAPIVDGISIKEALHVLGLRADIHSTRINLVAISGRV